jgi:hypothetical protein
MTVIVNPTSQTVNRMEYEDASSISFYRTGDGFCGLIVYFIQDDENPNEYKPQVTIPIHLIESFWTRR